jgi:hypothetical protein
MIRADAGGGNDMVGPGEDDGLAEAYPHRYLDTLRSIAEAGVDLAVPAALHYCAQNKVPPPEWLAERASNMLNALLHLQDVRARKRMRQMIITYKKNQIHYDRYDAVLTAKEARASLLTNLQEVRGVKGRNARRITKDVEFTLGRLGPNDETIFEEVKFQLRKTEAAGGAEAIKKSYQQLSKEERQGKSMLKYHGFDQRFLHRIGAFQKL